MRETEYVVVEWIPDLPQYPRYGFATAKHAHELGATVERLQICESLELAARITNELNARDLAGRAHRGTGAPGDQPTEISKSSSDERLDFEITR